MVCEAMKTLMSGMYNVSRCVLPPFTILINKMYICQNIEMRISFAFLWISSGHQKLKKQANNLSKELRGSSFLIIILKGILYLIKDQWF